jgi:peptidyl-prolyl cis-trans isomerase D
MLQAIRDKVRGWVAYAIVALLVVPFATVGVYNYVTGGANPAVAEVNGEEITRVQLDRAVQQYQSQLRSTLGDSYQRFVAALGPDLIRRQQLEQLVLQEVLQQYIRSEGIRVTDAAVRERIRQIPAFQVDGRFSNDVYQRFLQGRGLSAAQFEAGVRQNLALQRLQEGVQLATVVAQPELERAAAIEFQRRDFDWLRVDAAKAGAGITLSEADMEAYYDDHQSRFERPEQVQVEYVRLTREALAESVSVSDAEVSERYQELRESRYTEPETRSVRHILFEIPEDAGEDVVAQTREQAEAARQRLLSGDADFADLAAELSDDAGSAADGGSLGRLAPGDLGGGPLEQAVFELEPNVVSEPVRSEFGWHLVQVTDVHGGEVTPLEEVADELRRQIAADRAATRFFEATNEMADLAFESADSLQPVANALGLEVRTSEWFSRNQGTGIAAQQAVREAAFNEDVLGQGYNSQVLELGDGEAVVLRVSEHRPETVLPFDQVREQVRQALRAERNAEAAMALAESLQSEIESGAAPAELAEQHPAVTLEGGGWLSRQDNADAPPLVVRELFAMPRPQGDAPVASTTAIGTGDVAVVVLDAVRDGELASLSESERQQLRTQLQQMEAQIAWQELLANLRASADVSIYGEESETASLN